MSLDLSTGNLNAHVRTSRGLCGASTRRGVLFGLIVALLLGFLGTNAAADTNLFVNPGFETGNLDGWTFDAAPSGGAGSVLSMFGDPGPSEYAPADGLFLAVLTPGQGGSYTTLDQQVTVTAGATLNGWAFFKTTETTDVNTGTFANDDGEVVIQSGVADLATVFSEDVKTVHPVDINHTGQTPWTRWSYTFTSAGTYTVEARVRNAVDAVNPSYLGLDGLDFGDATAPTTTITLSPATPGGQNGWYVSDVHAEVAASDNPGGSGVAETRCVLDPGTPRANLDDIPTGCPYAQAGAYVITDGTHVLYAASKDTAGNNETPLSKSFKIDKTPPQLAPTVSPNPISLDGTAIVSPNASDPTPGSGLASASCDPIDTSSVGVKTGSCTATDTAGNRASASYTYVVGFAFAGFFSPVDNPPTLNAVKAGSAIPVKFSLAGNQGLSIFIAGPPSSQRITCDSSAPVEDVEQTVSAGSSSLSYDASSAQYIYVWKTDKAWAGSCRQLDLRLVDGSDHIAHFKFGR